MNRIKYKDIDVLKEDYKGLFSSHRFQNVQRKWDDARVELIRLGGDNRKPSVNPILPA